MFCIPITAVVRDLLVTAGLADPDYTPRAWWFKADADGFDLTREGLRHARLDYADYRTEDGHIDTFAVVRTVMTLVEHQHTADHTGLRPRPGRSTPPCGRTWCRICYLPKED